MLQVLKRETDFTSAVVNGAALHLWHGQTSLPGVEHLHQAIVQAARTERRAVPIVIIVEPGAPPPSAEARRVIANVMRDSTPLVSMTGLVYEGTGFGAAAIRSVVTGLNLLARHPFPYKVFADVNSTLAWIRESDPKAADSLEQGLGVLREGLANAS